jgi:lycopene beta-cyclase
MDDLLLIGGGLANGLLAWRLGEVQPDIRWRLLEQGSQLGGNHTWSFHATDVSDDAHSWLAPLVTHQWDGYEVRFPAHSRQLQGRYFTITSHQLHQRLMERFAERIHLDTTVQTLDSQGAIAGGRRWEARAVIDGRGYEPSAHLRLGYQKFLGLEVETAAHGLTRPLLMDATVDQTDGYRFFYVLPFSPTRLLIEDTRYSNHPALDRDALRQDIHAYAQQRGWAVQQVLREEEGVLPVTLDGHHEAFWQEDARQCPVIGMRAGLWHATTGYSLPDAVRLVEKIVAHPDLHPASLHALIRQHARAHWRAQRFYRMLNRMLFLAAKPAQRYKVLERFYRLPEPLIARFYAGHSSFSDQCRILAGKPPVPMSAACRSMAPGAAWKEAA